MTREEEMKIAILKEHQRNQAIEQEARETYPYWEDAFLSFCRGAHWADQTMIDKAWDWLTDQKGERTKEDFIKAMKGE